MKKQTSKVSNTEILKTIKNRKVPQREYLLKFSPGSQPYQGPDGRFWIEHGAGYDMEVVCLIKGKLFPVESLAEAYVGYLASEGEEPAQIVGFTMSGIFPMD